MYMWGYKNANNIYIWTTILYCSIIEFIARYFKIHIKEKEIVESEEEY